MSIKNEIRSIANKASLKYFSRIYIDTSAIRSIKGNANIVSKRKRYFTSALVLVELLAHYFEDRTEDKFRMVKSRVGLLKRNNIRIDWLLPEEVLCRSLPDLSPQKSNVGNLIEVVNVFLFSENQEEFWENIKDAHLDYDVELILNYDKHKGRAFNSPDTIKSLRGYLEQDIKNGSLWNYFYKDSELSSDNFNHIFENLIEDKLEEIKDLFFFMLISQYLNKEFEISWDNYDRKLELFMCASSVHFINKISNYNNYKRNDMIDLFHLMYVAPGTKIATNEIILIEYVKKYQAESLYDINEFKYDCKI